jgi:hypothetical protein
MPLGPGKYDALATDVRNRANAEGVIVIVFGGHLGNGFSVQAPLDITLMLPEYLREMADNIDASLKAGLGRV